MADSRSLTTISEADYDAIESAVMETDRGRWFLKEFTRRNRNADTQVLLDAIGRLEEVVAGERVAQDVDRLRANLKEMATAIARTKTDIASIETAGHEHSRLFEASEALDAITRTTELATSDILAAAEHIQESAWTLREAGADAQLCDDLDRRATEIYTACSFQDITAQRIAKVVQTLRYLEGRIDAMIAIWDRTEAAYAPGDVPPPRPREAEPDATDLDQSDIDGVISGGDPFEAAREAAGASADGPTLEGSERGILEDPDLPAETLDGWTVAAASFEADPDPSGPFDFVTLDAESVGENRPSSNTGRSLALPTPLVTDVGPDDLTFIEHEPGPAPVEPRPRADAFAEIDRMPTREKLRAFT